MARVRVFCKDTKRYLVVDTATRRVVDVYYPYFIEKCWNCRDPINLREEPFVVDSNEHVFHKDCADDFNFCPYCAEKLK